MHKKNRIYVNWFYFANHNHVNKDYYEFATARDLFRIPFISALKLQVGFKGFYVTRTKDLICQAAQNILVGRLQHDIPELRGSNAEKR